MTVSLAFVTCLFFSSCGSSPSHHRDTSSKMIVSVKDQTMLLTQRGKPVKAYKVLGNTKNSKRTPLGKLEVAKKIGGGAPSGAVFKSRVRTGRIMRPNTKGRDPIVTRIMWLKGNEYRNRHTFSRYIYIHGTPAEHKIGTPASYGCIRMKSKDVIDLYRRVGVGAQLEIINEHMRRIPEGKKSAFFLRRLEKSEA